MVKQGIFFVILTVVRKLLPWALALTSVGMNLVLLGVIDFSSHQSSTPPLANENGFGVHNSAPKEHYLGGASEHWSGGGLGSQLSAVLSPLQSANLAQSSKAAEHYTSASDALASSSSMEKPEGVRDSCWNTRVSDLRKSGPRVYVYDIPYYLREELRKQWYRIYCKDTVGAFDHSTLNYGFGAPMAGSNIGDILRAMKLDSAFNETSIRRQLSDYYFTHMHSMEIFFNERLKSDMMRSLDTVTKSAQQHSADGSNQKESRGFDAKSQNTVANSQGSNESSTVRQLFGSAKSVGSNGESQLFTSTDRRQRSKWVTMDPLKADLFIIPYPFALNYRVTHKNDWWIIEAQHKMLQNWLDENPVYNLFHRKLKKMHVITFGRIAYETGQMTRRGSVFWSDTDYYVVSIDRNCHGDVRSCLTRFSMPHPSAFHPPSVLRLKQQLDASRKSSRQILVSFCGAVRTPTRQGALDVCNKEKRHAFKHKAVLRRQFAALNEASKGKWQETGGTLHKGEEESDGRLLEFEPKLCAFEDSQKVDKKLKEEAGVGSFGERRRRIEIIYAKQCIDLYAKSVFCIQEGADSTTRKGLWDGMIQGCIPVFLHGVMSQEFECFGAVNQPWFVVLHPTHYVRQLMALPIDYVLRLQRNVRRMVPKLLYTDGNAGFSDAFDVIVACLLRYSQLHNKQCTLDEMLLTDWYDTDELLGYPKLYQTLGI